MVIATHDGSVICFGGGCDGWFGGENLFVPYYRGVAVVNACNL